MQKETKNILGLGHPRSGTKYLAKFLINLGLDVGHETMRKDGIVSWMFAVNTYDTPFGDNSSPMNYNFNHVIHVIRNPFDAIKSISNIEDTSISSLNFREAHLNIPNSLNGYNFSTYSYVKWNKLILKKNPDLTVQLENCEKPIFGYLKKNGFDVQYKNELNNDVNSRNYYKTSNEELLSRLNYTCKNMLLDFKENIYDKININ